MKWVLLFFSMFTAPWLQAQPSVDSRICTCFSQPVNATFLQSTKAFYGRIGIVLSPGTVLKPAQGQPVRFQMPALPVAAGCTAYYRLYVTDSAGRKIYEAAGTRPDISYVFPGCGRNYEVQLMASASAASGREGNCSRSLRFQVVPPCNTVSCNCFMQKGGKAAVSGDLDLIGSMQCLPVNGSQRRYVLKWSVLNKTGCMLRVQSVTLHGQTLEVPPFTTAPRGKTEGMSLGFSTPLSQSPPADNRVNAVIRYTLNGKPCAVNIEIPYSTCQ